MYNAQPIWGAQIPCNSEHNKYEDMTVTKLPVPVVMLNWIRWVFGTKLMTDNHGHDDYVDRNVIKKGLAKDTYTDVPTITPYIVPGSEKSVVIAPGGGFCMVSTDNEGIYPAKLLNSAGISAFVLDYRLEPYRAPVPYIDMQRAIRYVRAHASEWGISADCVGAMGSSAGGYTAAAAAEFLGNEPVSVEGYTLDETDRENGMPDFLILMYPVTNFDENPNMLANLKGPEFYTNPAKRALWTKEYSLIGNHERSKDVPTFLCYGGKDMLKGMDRYAKTLESNPSSQTLFLAGAAHGFCGNPKWTQWEQPLLAWIGNLRGKE